MFIHTKTGCFAVGTAGKNGEYKEVGEKKSSLLKFSLAVGKDDKDQTIWFDCQAWNPVAKRFKDRIKKGEVYQVSGIWESREYNGKTLRTLVIQFINELASEVQQTPTGFMSDRDNNDIPTEFLDDDVPDFMK